MEKFKTSTETSANVVLFDGLSIPQEDVYQNSHLLCRQTPSNSKFLTSYENDFKKFINANKISKFKCQLGNWAKKEEDQSLSLTQKLKLRKSSHIFSSNTSLNKTLSYKHSVADLTQLCTAVSDNNTLWKQDAEITHKSLCDSQSQLNGTSTIEDAYLCRVDPSKLLLKDVDYLRAKCRWNYKHISDYALNPKIVERIRYLEMFTQCFSIRNYENEYHADAEQFSDNSNFGEGDEFDIYKKPRCTTYDLRAINDLDFKNSNLEQKGVTYDSRTIDDLKNIPERDNYTVALQENTDLEISGTFKSKVFTVSVPNVINSMSFNQRKSNAKHLEDSIANSCIKQNNSPFKTLVSRAKSSKNSFFNTNPEKKETSLTTFNSSDGSKKSKCFFTTYNSHGKSSHSNFEHSEKMRNTRSEIKSMKSSDYGMLSAGDVGNKLKHRIDSGSDVKCESRSKELHLETDKLEDKGACHQIVVCKSRDKVQKEKSKTKSFITNEILSQRSFIITSSNENRRQQNEGSIPTSTKSSIKSEQMSKDENRLYEESNIWVRPDVSFNSATSSDYTESDEIQTKVFDSLNEKPSESLDLKDSDEERYRSDYIATYDTDHYETDNEIYNEDFDDDSEFSETSFSSRESEIVRGTELFNKYFLNEFIMSVFRPSMGEIGITLSETNSPVSSEITKIDKPCIDYMESKCDVDDSRNENSVLSSDIPYNKNDKPIIIIEYNSKTNEIRYNKNRTETVDAPLNQLDSLERCCYSKKFIENDKKLTKTSATSLEVNSSNTDSKLTTIQEGSDTGSENKPCEISFKILGTADSESKINNEAADIKIPTKIKKCKKNKKLVEADYSELSDNLKHRSSGSSIHRSSDSSLQAANLKTKKNKMIKKKKIKKQQCSKNNDTLMKNGRRDIRAQIKNGKKAGHNNFTNNSCNNNAGQNVYISCWKKYCVIL